MQQEARALERQISDSDTEDDEEILEDTGSQRKKIIWNPVAQFDSEEEAELYLAHSGKLLRTYTTKFGRKSCTFYCQPHGKLCLVQFKNEHVPRGKYLMYQSNDKHKESLGKASLL